MDRPASLNQLDTLLLLALSGQTNLVVSRPAVSGTSQHSRTALQQYILSFCEHPSIKRRAHVVHPSASADQRTETSRDDLLEATFVDVKSREIPQVLIVPGLDEYPPTAQRALYESVRDARFTLFRETHNLPRKFVLVGIVQQYSGLSNYLVRELSFATVQC